MNHLSTIETPFTIEPVRLETRFGTRIEKIHAVGSYTMPPGEWFVRVTLAGRPNNDNVRRIHPAEIRHEQNDDDAAACIREISAAVMKHLAEHGEWNARGNWSPKKGK